MSLGSMSTEEEKFLEAAVIATIAVENDLMPPAPPPSLFRRILSWFSWARIFGGDEP